MVVGERCCGLGEVEVGERWWRWRVRYPWATPPWRDDTCSSGHMMCVWGGADVLFECLMLYVGHMESILGTGGRGREVGEQGEVGDREGGRRTG